MKIPEKITTVVTDMDGTVYLSDAPIKGAIEAIERLRRRFRVLFLTNNTSVSGDAYVKKLRKMGISAVREDIITSGDAAAHFLKASYPDRKFFVLGTEAFKTELIGKGIKVDEENADAVLVAFDTELTYKKLERACDLIRSGAPFISTHPDVNCPKKGGFMPDAGSFLALIEVSTGRKPDYICGKPEKIMTEYLLDYVGTAPDKIMMIGDRLYTDIKFASVSGFLPCLVLSGETTPEMAESYDKKPLITVGSIAELE